MRIYGRLPPNNKEILKLLKINVISLHIYGSAFGAVTLTQVDCMGFV
jgi:hypothetical protein